MAKIDDLLDDIPDPRLRSELRKAVNKLRSARTFGLVFEDHIPEEVALPGLSVRTGSIVQDRTCPDETTKYEVVDVAGDAAQIRSIGNGDATTTVPVRDLMVVRRFGEPIYPGLTQVGEVRRGPDDKPAHAVINAENFHALQMLTYTHAGKVDVIYIDPPYNTGDKSWKYNNRFVDANDQWRHSKWLSMMEKRLKLARVLLKQDSVLIVTIDEHEVHHLGLLLEKLFPDAYRQMVTIVNNPKGVTQERFSRVEEYAIFCFFGKARVLSGVDDLLTWGGESAGETGAPPRWKGLLRSGKDAKATDRMNMCFPIRVDTRTGAILGVGESLRDLVETGAAADADGFSPDIGDSSDPQFDAWPIRKSGSLGRWGLSPEAVTQLVEQGYIRAGGYDDKRRTYAISYLSAEKVAQIEAGLLEVVDRDPLTGVVDARYVDVASRRPKTVWHRSAHDAGHGGADLITTLVSQEAFEYPKSVYAVLDCLETVDATHSDAVVLDFFAGSGTTLHALALLNARDGGTRRAILVTNNDVSHDEAEGLYQAGVFPGDQAFERHGIFEAVTIPRVEAAITGERVGQAIQDERYLSSYLKREIGDGLTENAVLFRLDYLDPDVVSVGRQYAAIAPLLWLAAGSVGRWTDREGDEPWSLPESSNYAVLFDEDRFAAFMSLVEGSEWISHVWLVTNSSQSFAEMRSQLPDGLEVQMLYRDYLSNFRVNTAETFS